MNVDIVFPEGVAVKDGTIKYSNGDAIDPLKYLENIITLNEVEYNFIYLDARPGNKGGNSIILKLYETQNLTFDDYSPQYDIPDLILKINKKNEKRILDKGSRRFQNEIMALRKCREQTFENIIRVYDSGHAIIDRKSYQYYTMEYADMDLKNFIESKHNELTIDTKVNLCISLARGLNELNSLNVYHRDLKPDNIFIAENGQWKIGDLGLIAGDGTREYINNLDEVNEFVGPRGWISPEAMNKYLTEEKGFYNLFDCNIDHQSDIYQLGKIFWYIFQHNSPLGYLTINDFLIKDQRLFYLIRSMLCHSKRSRVKDISEVISILLKIEKSLLKVA